MPKQHSQQAPRTSWAPWGLAVAVLATAGGLLLSKHQQSEQATPPNGVEFKTDAARQLARLRTENLPSVERGKILEVLQRNPQELLLQRESLLDMLRDPRWENRFSAMFLVTGLGKDGTEFSNAIMLLLKSELPGAFRDGRWTGYLSPVQVKLDQLHRLPWFNQHTRELTDRTIVAAEVLERGLNALTFCTNAVELLTEARGYCDNPQYHQWCDQLIEAAKSNATLVH